MRSEISAPNAAAHPQEMTGHLEKVAGALGEITSLLIRTPYLATYTIADLEWLVLPAMTNQQFLIVRAPLPGKMTPLTGAAILWASLSDELYDIDRQSPDQRHRLAAEDRRSGPNIWVSDLLGDPLLCQQALKKLRAGTFRSSRMAVVRRDPDGTATLIEHLPVA